MQAFVWPYLAMAGHGQPSNAEAKLFSDTGGENVTLCDFFRKRILRLLHPLPPSLSPPAITAAHGCIWLHMAAHGCTVSLSLADSGCTRGGALEVSR